MSPEPSAVNEKKKRKKENDPPQLCKRKGKSRELSNLENYLQQPTAAEAEVPASDDEEDKIYYVNDADVDQFSLV